VRLYGGVSLRVLGELAIFGKLNMATKILRLMGVLDTVCVSKSTIYQWVADGKFPAPVRLGPRSVGWRQSEVDAWLESRQSARNADRTAGA
jgi:prophage regulatory protein